MRIPIICAASCALNWSPALQAQHPIDATVMRQDDHWIRIGSGDWIITGEWEWQMGATPDAEALAVEKKAESFSNYKEDRVRSSVTERREKSPAATSWIKALNMVIVAVPVGVPPALNTTRNGDFSPPSRGRVTAQFRWIPCVRGRHLSTLDLRHADVVYVLSDLTVVDCSPESATFAYGSLSKANAR